MGAHSVAAGKEAEEPLQNFVRKGWEGHTTRTRTDAYLADPLMNWNEESDSAWNQGGRQIPRRVAAD